jgi:hypothetical protein
MFFGLKRLVSKNKKYSFCSIHSKVEEALFEWEILTVCENKLLILLFFQGMLKS